MRGILITSALMLMKPGDKKKKTKQEEKYLMCFEHRPSSLSLYSADHLENWKRLCVIAALSAQQRRATTDRKEVRDITVMQITEVSHALPKKLQVNSVRITLMWCL